METIYMFFNYVFLRSVILFSTNLITNKYKTFFKTFIFPREIKGISKDQSQILYFIILKDKLINSKSQLWSVGSKF